MRGVTWQSSIYRILRENLWGKCQKLAVTNPFLSFIDFAPFPPQRVYVLIYYFTFIWSTLRWLWFARFLGRCCHVFSLCCWRFVWASFLWQFDAILLSHRSVGHFRVVSGSHKFRHVRHFVACWDINSMPMSNVLASYIFRLFSTPLLPCVALLGLPFTYTLSVWEHNLFALVFAAQETSLLFPGWLEIYTHTHTHGRRTAVHVFSIS